jgi:DNA polymerase
VTFPADQPYVVLDYETYSEAPLKRVGSYEYSLHPTTEVLCASWRTGTHAILRQLGRPRLYAPLGDPVQAEDQLEELATVLSDADNVVVAHNALFEQAITANTLPRVVDYLPFIPPHRWLCTAALASALALPRSLESAARVLDLDVQKDLDGVRILRKWMKPRRPSKRNPATRHLDPDEYARLCEYCATDVAAEVELFLTLPPLTDIERQVWELDQVINLRGFCVDRPLVQAILQLIAAETQALHHETREITGGIPDTTAKRDKLLEWLRDNGVGLPDLTKATVEWALGEDEVQGPARRVLEIRQAVSKTSTAKYRAFDLRSRHDGRLRDILVYHAASTGRWGGAGVQPQNFPKGTASEEEVAEVVWMAETNAGYDAFKVRYGNGLMDTLSSCLRGMIVAPTGHVLDVADYNAIEARVLFWVAGHSEGLAAFHEGRDLYRELASVIYGRPVTKDDTTERFVGKTSLLGAGYGLGAKKFRATCRTLGQEISEDLAETAIHAYRETHEPVACLWNIIEQVAIKAVLYPGNEYTRNRTTWWVEDDFLWCQLPGGRRLAYHRPTVENDETPWGRRCRVLYHYGVDAISKKWVRQRTWGGKLVENVVSAIARDLMAEAMLRIEAAGPWEVVLSVHDELVAERYVGHGAKGSHDEFCQLMARLPEWANGLPVKVAGFSSTRYRK